LKSAANEALGTATTAPSSGGGIDPISYSQHFDVAWQLVEQDRFGDTTGTDPIAKTLFTYDPAGRVQTLSHQDALSQVLANYQYTYDTAGELTQEVHHGITFNYQYDKDGQLTSTTRSDQPTPDTQSYDANGNRTDASVVVGADSRVLSDADFTYQYDNEGNLIQKVSKANGEITTYTYDFRNRLIDVTTTSAGGIVLESEQYRYDVFDRRIDVLILFGGHANVYPKRSEGKFFTDTWVYDYRADTWTEMKPKDTPAGSSVRFMAFDPVNNVAINVHDGGPKKQTWVYRYKRAGGAKP